VRCVYWGRTRFIEGEACAPLGAQLGRGFRVLGSRVWLGLPLCFFFGVTVVSKLPLARQGLSRLAFLFFFGS
jgi:hypothetical protein